MYDDRMTRKIEGAQKILLLCLIPENQEIMISHGENKMLIFYRFTFWRYIENFAG
jgi:hypothetical protein